MAKINFTRLSGHSEVESLLSAFTAVNPDDVRQILNRLIGIVSAKGRPCDEYNRRATAVMRACGTPRFKPLYKKLLYDLDLQVYTIGEDAQAQADRVNELVATVGEVISQCARASGILDYELILLAFSASLD
jgi:hypothetical protein